MNREQKKMELINEVVNVSFDNITKHSNNHIEIKAEIKFEENIMNIIFEKCDGSLSVSSETEYNERYNFYNEIWIHLVSKKENQEILGKKEYFNYTCFKLLSSNVMQEFKKSSYYRFESLYDPYLKRMFD